jgi:hypothetical protein
MACCRSRSSLGTSLTEPLLGPLYIPGMLIISVGSQPCADSEAGKRNNPVTIKHRIIKFFSGNNDFESIIVYVLYRFYMYSTDCGQKLFQVLPGSSSQPFLLLILICR